MTPARVASMTAWLAGLAVAALVAYAVAERPLETAALLAAAATLLTAWLSKTRSAALVRFLVTSLLLGYAFFGRSFAYLGRPPYYVGEIVLVLVVLASLAGGAVLRAFRSKLVWVLALFGAWGAIRTIPYVPVYGTDAMRDAAIWGYGAFALVVAGWLVQGRYLETLRVFYGKAAPVYLVWVIALGAAGYTSFSSVSRPDAALAFHVKAGDASVHLAGIGAFLILGLHRTPSAGRRLAWLREWSLWACWVAGFLLFGSLNRGGLLSMLVGISVVLLLRFRSNWLKLAVVGLAGGIAFLALGMEVDLGGTRRISPQQIFANLDSVAGGGNSIGEGTRRWRLQWWRTIVDYTVRGEYFWSGKGFGVNLADEDGFQTDRGHALRSAHNGHMTVLARSGMPGFALWVLLNGGLCVGLLRAYYQARAARDRNRAALILWILAYLAAALVNSTFDVYLEGPQGGIWFWALAGTGMALVAGRRTAPAKSGERTVPVWAESWKMQRC